jgi:radical SAM protein with 4Fe4S-binding SPASM domain
VIGRFRYRFERFGGVMMFAKPALLVTAGRAFLRSCGLDGGAAWEGPEESDAQPKLSAPVEAHLALTNACTAGCEHCYQSSGEPLAGELGREGMLKLVDSLADAGVFHVALGGGESFLLPWLFDVAEHARARGMVPNVTTSGLALSEDTAKRCRVFGRVNVSLDGVDPSGYGEFRRAESFAKADRAIRLLRAHHPSVGINTVVTRSNAARLEEIVRYAVDRRLDEVELLRLKPAGRATAAYLEHRPTDAQNRALLPDLLAIRRRHRIAIKVDCSFAPMVAWTGVDPEVLEFFSVLGCEGGDYLVGIDAAGSAKPCSFEHDDDCRIPAADLAARWRAPDTFSTYRDYLSAAPEPCASCRYRTICRGGCRVVAKFLTGDPKAPDPECPRVIEHAKTAGGTPIAEKRRALPVIA